LKGMSVAEVAKRLGLTEKEVVRGQTTKKEIYEYFCQSCGAVERREQFTNYIQCKKCGSPVQSTQKPSTEEPQLNFTTILGLDEVLISSRHLYRMAFSLHEKSGLASLPINPDKVLDFEKSQADPFKVTGGLLFLDDSESTEQEGELLLIRSLDFTYKPTFEHESSFKPAYTSENIETIEEKVPIEFFPPAILNILKGIKDGKKRALFVLVNFLTYVGWPYDDIDELLHTWNEKNQDPLRETNIKSHLTYHKNQKKKVLPPNYSNNMYYADLGVLTDEDLKFKNPVAYTKRRLYFFKQQEKKKKKSIKSEKKEDKPSDSK